MVKSRCSGVWRKDALRAENSQRTVVVWRIVHVCASLLLKSHSIHRDAKVLEKLVNSCNFLKLLYSFSHKYFLEQTTFSLFSDTFLRVWVVPQWWVPRGYTLLRIIQFRSRRFFKRHLCQVKSTSSIILDLRPLQLSLSYLLLCEWSWSWMKGRHRIRAQRIRTLAII